METDWARTVRTLRARLNLNQAGFARLVDVSQTYISRLESGRIRPTERVAEAILRLAENPRTRSAFDDFLASVRHNPYACCLIGAKQNELQLIAASVIFTARFGDADKALAEGAVLETCARHLIRAGILSGEVDRADCLYKPGAGLDAHWRAVFTPIRDETGEWFMHAMLREISAEDYEARLDEQGGEACQVTLLE